MTGDIIARIDEALSCQQCGNPDPPGDFCSDPCQRAWHAERSVALPPESRGRMAATFERASGPGWGAPLAEPADGEPGSFRLDNRSATWTVRTAVDGPVDLEAMWIQGGRRVATGADPLPTRRGARGCGRGRPASHGLAHFREEAAERAAAAVELAAAAGVTLTPWQRQAVETLYAGGSVQWGRRYGRATVQAFMQREAEQRRLREYRAIFDEVFPALRPDPQRGFLRRWLQRFRRGGQ